MYTLNITTKVDNNIIKDWLTWQMEDHIPRLLTTNCFITYRFYQLLEQDDSEGQTFVLQLVAASLDKYLEFLHSHAEAFKDSTFSKWDDRYFEFRSLLRNVD